MYTLDDISGLGNHLNSYPMCTFLDLKAMIYCNTSTTPAGLHYSVLTVIKKIISKYVPY